MKTLDVDVPSKKAIKKKKIIIIACENRTHTTVARHKASDSLGTSRRPPVRIRRTRPQKPTLNPEHGQEPPTPEPS